jgi:hypothetical protein
MIAACGYYRFRQGVTAPLNMDVQPGLRLG